MRIPGGSTKRTEYSSLWCTDPFSVTAILNTTSTITFAYNANKLETSPLVANSFQVETVFCHMLISWTILLP